MVGSSPYTMHVTAPTASAPLCVLRGTALTRAVSRKEEVFECCFKDANGQVAHAAELDVYVSLLSMEVVLTC